jgi:hypothetical protein
MILNPGSLRGAALLVCLVMGCGGRAIDEVSEGIAPLPDVTGPLTAREALAIVQPMALDISDRPVLVLITSGFGINSAGRSFHWEFVFHFPDRSAQAVYSFAPGDPDLSGSVLQVEWRLSPRSDFSREQAGLPPDFTDSPEAARELAGVGVDWVAGDSDLTLATKRLSSGEVVWTAESHGEIFRIPFK